MTPRTPDRRIVWDVSLCREALTDEEEAYLAGLPEEVPAHAWVCKEMDRVWHQLGLDNRLPLAGQPVGEFYGHPVWLMNGLFSAADPVSASQRRAIASYVAGLAPSRVADLGGGFGELAQQISRAVPSADVVIVEPFPKQVARARLAETPQVRFAPELEARTYDAVVAQDVLEHVEEPVDLAIDVARSARPGGTVIFANNFTPIIACHLPATFHLQRTFRLVMRGLGLVYKGRVPGAEHADIFDVPAALHVQRAWLLARASRFVAPALEAAAALGQRLPRGFYTRMDSGISERR